MSVISAASESSVQYLADLHFERYGSVLPAEQVEGLSQSAISGKINTLLADDGIVPTTDDQLDEIAALSESLGITLDPGETQAKANRQIRAMRKSLQRRDYVKGAADFEAFLGTLRPPTTDDESIPF